MNKERFTQLLGQSESFSSSAIEELEQVAKDYPWNSTSQILLALAMNDHGLAGFDTQLHKASVYAGSRTHLFNLLNQEKAPAASVVEEPGLAEIPAQQEEAEVVQEVQKEVEEPKRKELDPLSEQMLVDAVSRSIEQEVSEDIGTAIPEEKEEHAVEDQKSDVEAEQLSPFSSWIYNRAKSIGYETSFSESSTPEASDDDLIDKFIKTEPKIKRREFDELKNNELAKRSLVEDETLVTETMAKIYEQQGKMDKARRAYELLSLKYPEKSIYFADRIKSLSKK
jgi:hypothetical protein